MRQTNTIESNEDENISEFNTLIENIINREHITFIDDNQPLKICDSNIDDEISNIEEETYPFDDYRMPPSETAYVADVQYTLRDDAGIAVAPGDNKTPLRISDKNYEVLPHLYLFPSAKIGYTFQRVNSLSPCKYFNQILMNYTQNLRRTVTTYFWHSPLCSILNLISSINIAMQKIKSNNLTAGILSQQLNN